VSRLPVLALVAVGATLAAATPAAAGSGDCLRKITTTRTGDGDLKFWGTFSGYRGGPPRGTLVPPSERVLGVGGIFSVPKGMTIEYTTHGLHHTFTGPGRWGTYCLLVKREGTDRDAFLATQFWGGTLEDEGPARTFRDAYTVTPEGRVAMNARRHVHYNVERSDGRTIASVFKDGGRVYVTASDNLSKKTPCQQGQDVVIEHDGEIHPG
jgi:hypothetical protein